MSGKEPYNKNMRITRLGLLSCGILLWTTGAMAQVSCEVSADAITRFRAPEYSLPIVWRAVVADKGIEQFSDGVQLDDQHLVLGGIYTAKKDDAAHRPLLVRMEPRGKILWQVRAESKTDQTIERVVLDEGMIVTLGALAGEEGKAKKLIVTRYDLEGNKKAAFALNEPDGDLIPAGIVPIKDGYLFAARYENLTSGGQQFGVLYKTNKEGKRIWRRAYIPGMTTDVDHMLPLKSGDLLLAGNVTDNTGRLSGWAIRLDRDGGIKWQQSYPRGKSAQYTHAAELADGSGYILGGTSRSLSAERGAAWVAKISASGNTVWERFYDGPEDYRLTDLSVLPDGRSLAMISAMPVTPPSEDNLPHMRLVTLSPRGDLLQASSVTDGHGLIANRLINADHTPVLIGTIKTALMPDTAKEKAPKAGKGAADDKGGQPKAPPAPVMSYDGWVAQLQPLASYDDPCVKR